MDRIDDDWMAWLILDSNQVGAFVSRITKLPRCIDGLTLNPQVFGEIVLTRRLAWLHHLMRFPVRFGIDTAGIMDRVAAAPIGRIPAIDTYLDRRESVALRERFRAMTSIPAELISEGERVKNRNLEFQRDMLARVPSAQDRLKRENSGVLPRRENPGTVLREIVEARALAGDVLAAIGKRDGNKLVDGTTLVDAALENVRLRRWFSIVAFFYYSLSGLWWDQSLNVKSAERDDWTDMSNVLYARNGDLLLTADGWLRRAIDVVEDAVQASVRLRCVTVADLEAMC